MNLRKDKIDVNEMNFISVIINVLRCIFTHLLPSMICALGWHGQTLMKKRPTFKTELKFETRSDTETLNLYAVLDGKNP